MAEFPDGLTNEQYTLLRRIQLGNVEHFESSAADVLVERGFAVFSSSGDLSVTDAGMGVLRVLKINK